QENHDLLQPRRQGRYLYFTAVLDSEYLLRRMDLQSGRIEQLTDHGVVYGYDFLADGTLVYFHRDLRTPGALIAGGKVLESVPSGVDFRVERLPRHAIAFQPPARTRQAGTILYIGPLPADVSP